MAQQDLSDRINEFLKHAKDYWQWWQIEYIRGSALSQQVAEGATAVDAGGIAEAQGNRCEARNGLLKIGSVLAVELEAQDNDSSALLLFLYAIDGGGGPEAAGKGWPGLKVQLQRIVVRGKKQAGFVAEPKTASVKKSEWLGSALILLRDHPDWSDRAIAKEVGLKSSSALTRCPEYQAAIGIARRQSPPPLGYITTDHDTGDRDIEAIDPSGDR